MKRYLIFLPLIFSGCANFTINGTMCDEIASDPNAVMPQECVVYEEQKAQKAFDNTQTEVESKENIIKFNKDEDDKEN
jgi:hypothetical protein